MTFSLFFFFRKLITRLASSPSSNLPSMRYLSAKPTADFLTGINFRIPFQARHRRFYTTLRNALFSAIGSRLWAFAHRSRKQRGVHGRLRKLGKSAKLWAGGAEVDERRGGRTERAGWKNVYRSTSSMSAIKPLSKTENEARASTTGHAIMASRGL